MTAYFLLTRGRQLRALCVHVIAMCMFVATAGICEAQTGKKPAPAPAGKSTTITIASPEDEAKAAKKMALLDNAGTKMEAAKTRAEAYGKLVEGATATYAKAESPVREAADKLIAAYRDGKTLHEELAEAYKSSNSSRVESMLEKIVVNTREVTLLRDAPETRKQQVADLLEETATKQKASYSAVSDIFNKWVESRKVAGAAARDLADQLLMDGVADEKVDPARDAYLLTQGEKNALYTYMVNMNSIKQKQVGANAERAAQLAQAEQMANELLAATRESTAANVKYLKLGRQIDESLVEANQAIRDSAATPVKPPAARTTGGKAPETIDLSGKAKPPPKKKTGH